MARWIDTQEAALNAVFGDYLERCGNPLATRMQFYELGRPLDVTPDALSGVHGGLTARVVIFVHGMAQTEACWGFPEDPARSYGTLLRDEFGLTPFCLRYNTGRHVSQNGRELAQCIERLIAAYPLPVTEISLIGHSLGGLVVRSACHYAEVLELGWLARAKRAVYLGAPHLGSPYEKAGHLLMGLLGASDHPVVRLTVTLGNLRSAGVKDLRDGRLLDEDWQEEALDALEARRPQSMPLRAGMDHYLVAGALTRSERHVLARLFGDALVRLPSALDPGRRAALPPDHFAILPGVNHMRLAHAPEVYERLRNWFGPVRVESACVESRSSDRSAPSKPSAEQSGSSGALYQRVDAYRALVADVVQHGSAAVQQVQEELTRRPYDLLEHVPPLRAPVRLVRAAHFASLRGVYGAIRAANAVTAAALHEGLERLKQAGTHEGSPDSPTTAPVGTKPAPKG